MGVLIRDLLAWEPVEIRQLEKDEKLLLKTEILIADLKSKLDSNR